MLHGMYIHYFNVLLNKIYYYKNDMHTNSITDQPQ